MGLGSPSEQTGKDNVERSATFKDSFLEPKPDDVVSFSVVCVPRSGVDLRELRRRLSIETLGESLPTDKVRHLVADQLRTIGFQVFDLPSPVVSATGTVALFQQIFKAQLVKRVRTFHGSPPRVETAIVLAPDSSPSPDAVTGALTIVVADPPIPTVPRIPAQTAAFSLHLPGDIAQLTAASRTHRLLTPMNDRATGGGVGVAVIDTEFADHPYFRDHGYRIARLAPNDASCLGQPYAHGTSVLSCMLACAPDVQAFGIRLGVNAVLAFDLALAMPGVKVISFSFVWSLDGEATIPVARLPLQIRILTAVASGVTIVVAAGDGETETFPALMPEVVAVGGVTVDSLTDTISPWPGSSSFVSAIIPGRVVPDLCGMAEAILAPARGPAYWISSDGTSLATPQVAGIAALLIQKSPPLTPQQVRDALCDGAVPVPPPPPSPLTGAGVVNAFNSWTSIA
jgi:serine protease AprX